jgi:hypothetical protein
MIVDMGIFGEVELDPVYIFKRGFKGDREQPDEPDEFDLLALMWGEVDVLPCLDGDDVARIEEMILEELEEE